MKKDLHEALAGYRLVTTISLLWGDQDAFGHVNNTVYLKWAETARVDYMVKVAMWPALPPKQTGPILAQLNCNYKVPLTFPDKVHIGTRVVRIGNSSLKMEHVIVSHEADQVAATVDSTLVWLDYSTSRTVRIPDADRRAMALFEGNEELAAI